MKILYQLKIGDFAPSESSRSFTKEGYLKCVNVRLAKAPQVRQYYAYEFPSLEGFTADQNINVYTPADELFKPESVASFNGVDATDYHPPKNEINASNWKDYHIGYCENVRQEGDYLVGDLLIKDKVSIDLIQSNERIEMSLGYAALLVLENGTAPDGTPYQAKFINFIGNHVALVKYGRCGGDCRIGDQKPSPKGKIMEVEVNGIRFDIGDNKPLADALNIQKQQLENLKAAKLKVGDKQFSIGDELPAVQAVVDQLHTDKATLEQKVGDLEKNQMTPEKLEQAAAERASVIADAKALLPTVKTDGCTCEQIKRDVIASKTGDSLVTAVLGGVTVGDAKPEQVDMVFRALSAVKGTNPSNPVGDALNFQQQQKVGDQDPNLGKQEQGYSKATAYKTI
ncbi:DUF2213 domain-containing protein [Acinetobacter bereziniae]|uniref:DUF2213 domain-containing protein n=1 Tax=Acinetobacter bereziniae LMG 1003 = CIP 70.12 TaxID=981324 RepID=N9F046_ACIBZ|nr:DUF2213 domain-containing protein [Acinetobacter bereziniae]ENV98300.1 hypothetical protein F938_01154 [Acinetobacter bereziniae LMG 1003 = CIP 70.12]MBJ9908551.1 DUF2213 domain-containing protein [Acinetobacter bereziniae]MBJ9929860.1 DUF2213 domain-containing protein [Acinetobacter bereziniae]MDG3558387.1 DUF2213 domain-containing protein [Acinetobacter bereziniae]MDP6003544.1 DUF2213 domain-containing protein [Acinetobacter bereziniae]